MLVDLFIWMSLRPMTAQRRSLDPLNVLFNLGSKLLVQDRLVAIRQLLYELDGERCVSSVRLRGLCLGWRKRDKKRHILIMEVSFLDRLGASTGLSCASGILDPRICEVWVGLVARIDSAFKDALLHKTSNGSDFVMQHPVDHEQFSGVRGFGTQQSPTSGKSGFSKLLPLHAWMAKAKLIRSCR
jgi:hypothetical protein